MLDVLQAAKLACPQPRRQLPSGMRELTAVPEHSDLLEPWLVFGGCALLESLQLQKGTISFLLSVSSNEDSCHHILSD